MNIKLNIETGEITIISDRLLNPGRNEIIYHPSVFLSTAPSAPILSIQEIKQRYQNQASYVTERAMGEYGKRLFTCSEIPEDTVFLPYTGLYMSAAQHTAHHQDQYKDSPYNLQILEEYLTIEAIKTIFDHLNVQDGILYADPNPSLTLSQPSSSSQSSLRKSFGAAFSFFTRGGRNKESQSFAHSMSSNSLLRK